MQRFLQRFALLVAGTLSGLDRLVFRGKLCQLLIAAGMPNPPVSLAAPMCLPMFLAENPR